MPEIGKPAPDFTLAGIGRQRFTLSSLRGQPVVLAFYRGDGQPTCSRQLAQYATAYDRIRAMGAELWGVSGDSPDSHFAFGCRIELPFPLLADEDWAVAKQYKVASRILGYGRSTFVIDAAGILRKEMRPAMGGLLSYTSTDDIFEAVEEVQPA